MNNAKIETTGQLRQFLVSTLVDVKNGKVDTEKAFHVAKLAAQINESFYSEIKIARIQIELGNQGADLGTLPINVDSVKPNARKK